MLLEPHALELLHGAGLAKLVGFRRDDRDGLGTVLGTVLGTPCKTQGFLHLHTKKFQIKQNFLL